MHHPENIHDRYSQQLALQVDGLPLCGGAEAEYTMHAVCASFTGEELRQLESLNKAVGQEIGIVDSHFDDSPLVLRQLGFETRLIAGEDVSTTALRVIVISCPHRHTRLDSVDVRRFLERGGVLVSSDRAIRLPGIAAFLGHLPGRPPARGRLAIDESEGSPTIAPVWLDPGHLPIDPASLDDVDVTTMATNPLTGEPLVVMIRVGKGAIIHSVAHWLQLPRPDALTSVERRPLRDTPHFRHVGNSYPGISLGGFLAQRTMVDLLMRGLTATINVDKTAGRSRSERGK